MMIGPSTPYLTGSSLLAVEGLCDRDEREAAGQLAEADAIAAYASELVYVLTGRCFPGERQATVYPEFRAAGGYWPDRGYTGAYGLLGAGIGGCGYDAIRLHDPIVSIDEVIVDGEVLDPTLYRTRSHCELCRVDDKLWPRLTKPFPDGFSIQYTFGPPTPYSITAATQELAVDMWKADHNQRSKLPAGTTSASRQGTSVTIQRDVEAIRSAGPALEKLWHAIAAFNPNGQRTPPMISTPDSPWILHVFDEVVEGS